MISIDVAKSAAQRYAAAPKAPGIGTAKCAVCQENAGHFVRVVGPLTPFCLDHLPPHTKDAYGTYILDESGN